ncbi:uncharacterized protein DUF397 [Streptomyces sp. KhCrAH-43]|uniref:DUF397 domain-containing protein n=1 Tax=unclassified Streptomyces TaxID=2593676 RepID=UPI000374DF8A|nr:DUF397 domain-containing protein [Streptomyces sp. KhCrAH-43]MYS38611.1 DUF397 domain-containing protein [Streptomyces sp. SID4920]MYX66803.1 DUF397 domain-containing protein [Streptomyces sp. SID8373]RAJ68298.1 uncharacterized protein DUF397 [Streptomyces sp. KhCrAH-43]
MATETPRWYTSSYSNNGGDCVQVATNLVATTGTIPVRDSKVPDGPALTLRAGAFSAFVAGLMGDGFGPA